MKPVLFGFPCSVVKATMVIMIQSCIYKSAQKLPSANYSPSLVTSYSQIDIDLLADILFYLNLGTINVYKKLD